MLRCLENFPLSLSLPQSICVGFFSSSLFLLRQVSVMRCGACEESTGSLLAAKFLKVRRNRKIGNPANPGTGAARAGRPPQMFEHEAPVGSPHINAGSTLFFRL